MPLIKMACQGVLDTICKLLSRHLSVLCINNLEIVHCLVHHACSFRKHIPQIWWLFLLLSTINKPDNTFNLMNWKKLPYRRALLVRNNRSYNDIISSLSYLFISTPVSAVNHQLFYFDNLCVCKVSESIIHFSNYFLNRNKGH